MAAQKSEKAKKKHGRETRSAMITEESNYHVLDDMILSRSGSGLCNRGQDFLAVVLDNQRFLLGESILHY
jgi:hypothetical protein